MDWEQIGKGAGGLAAIGAALYGTFRMLRSDSRGDKNTETQDSAMEQVIEILRQEVARLAERVESLEEQNRKCREENAVMSFDIAQLRQKVAQA